jgi:YfiH family protein
VTILRSERLAAAGFSHAFPERDTGDAVLLRAMGAAPDERAPAPASVPARRVIQVKQVHGARAVLARDAEGQEADALVAREPGVAVGVRVADCVPLLVADEASGAVAAIHAGWRGVVGGVVRAGVELLSDPGAATGRQTLVAAIGPCIGACCFEVGRDVAAQIGFVVREHGDKAYVDLRAAVRSQLAALGLDDARIEDVAGCTKHEPQRFHSFRRDGANSGRMLAVIAARA